MAVMWPRSLPLEITSSVLRSAECRVYTRLHEVLDDSFVVFYSRPWLGLKPDGEEIDGECDFVVAHPEYGILTLEIKGGAISYNPETEAWNAQDRWGCNHRIKNPVYQAKTSKYQILRKLNHSRDLGFRRIRAHHGVIFPDSRNPGEENLGADIPEDMICFLEDFHHSLGKWILARMGADEVCGYADNPLGDDGIRTLEDILAHPIHLHFPLGKMISDDDHQITVLTQQQFQILSLIRKIPRARISGGAGTGKTILAIEEAVRLAEEGMRVLLTCYNRPLAQVIRKRTERTDRLTVANFHDLCHRYAMSAGILVPDDIPETILFRDVYPELLTQAVEKNPLLRFDAIIIDEGQDFLPRWFGALDTALEPDGHAVLRIFYDNNQSIYNFETRLPEDVSAIPLSLNRNLRNTQRICEIVRHYYSGPELIAAGPPGGDVEWIAVETQSEIQSALNDKIRALTEQEDVSPSDIAILTDSKGRFEVIAPDLRCGGIICHRCDAPRPAGVVLDTVRRFKGLESPVVFIILSRELADNRELLYVGLSRARAQLVVVGMAEEIDRVREVQSGQ